ncbi:hypothetical protein V1477_006343 [Vespula maculifrons]|uniref:Uncharacterized protein n=1 Tax=Vespula maculifrons TaxID=7453 RepID=A0ABD2CMR5_VESMC
MGGEGATSPLNDPGLVLLGAIVSEKKILKEKSVITRLLLVRSVRKKYARRGSDELFQTTPARAQRGLFNDPGRVLLGAIVSDKKILEKQCFLPLFPLNCYNSAPIGPMCTQKIWA